jgi:hypothetical protein
MAYNKQNRSTVTLMLQGELVKRKFMVTQHESNSSPASWGHAASQFMSILTSTIDNANANDYLMRNDVSIVTTQYIYA